MKNKAANTPVTFEEIAVVMIITGIVLNPYRGCKYDAFIILSSSNMKWCVILTLTLYLEGVAVTTSSTTNFCLYYV